MVLSIRRLFLFAVCAVLLNGQPAAASGKFEDGRVSFEVEINEVKSQYNVRACLVMPGETVRIVSTVPVFIDAAEKHLAESSDYRWTAPDVPGTYSLRLRHKPTEETVAVQVFVLTPHDRVKGYAIGKYPEKGGKYERPRGFIKVTAPDEKVWVSPHFQLRQFLCKQAGGYPKFVLVDERLLTKLELILERINSRGYRTDSLHVMSGFRTPAYNRSLGNVSLSRHLFGDAADIYVEGAGGQMADLNRDGKRNVADAEYLRALILELEGEGREDFAPGGVGHYRSTHSHGPYVHVDARGEKARWVGTGIKVAEQKGSSDFQY